MKFSNKTIGNTLKILLFVAVISAGIEVITTYFYITDFDFYLSFLMIDEAIIIFSFVLYYIVAILYLVWIVKVHQDFRKLKPNYPVSPAGAIARILVPFYNLYGLWNVYSTMVNFFNEHTNTTKHAKKIAILIPFYYLLFFVTIIMDRLISTEEDVDGQFFMSYFILDFVLMFIYLLMVIIILNAFTTFESASTDESVSEELDDMKIIEG